MTINHQSFSACWGDGRVEVVKINSDVQKILHDAFKDLVYLSLVEFPSSGLSKIEKNAFEGCTSLKTITLPKTLNKLGDNVFSGCSSLTCVELLNVPNNCGSSPFPSTLKTIIVPSSYSELTFCDISVTRQDGSLTCDLIVEGGNSDGNDSSNEDKAEESDSDNSDSNDSSNEDKVEESDNDNSDGNDSSNEDKVEESDNDNSDSNSNNSNGNDSSNEDKVGGNDDVGQEKVEESVIGEKEETSKSEESEGGAHDSVHTHSGKSIGLFGLIGIAVGSVLVVTLVASVVYLFVKRNRRRDSAGERDDDISACLDYHAEE